MRRRIVDHVHTRHHAGDTELELLPDAQQEVPPHPRRGEARPRPATIISALNKSERPVGDAAKVRAVAGRTSECLSDCE
jgi:hypothetical protein